MYSVLAFRDKQRPPPPWSSFSGVRGVEDIAGGGRLVAGRRSGTHNPTSLRACRRVGRPSATDKRHDLFHNARADVSQLLTLAP